MTYHESIEYLNTVEWKKGSRPGLARITELCERLNHPEWNIRFIHVAGTNGKGSVSAMLDAVLRAAGYRTGLFTSPHVEQLNERIRFDGLEISNDDLAYDTEAVKACADAMEDGPTAFELLTAIALRYYSRMKCEYVVLECGLGGRLDSTNVIPTAELSIITGIAQDHCAILGNTPEQIAAEKAGIIKPGVPILFGEGSDGAEGVIRAMARRLNCPYTRTEFSRITDLQADLDGTHFCFYGQEILLSLPGIHQARNAATALTAVDILRQRGIDIPEEAVRDGFAAVRWKARFEILSRHPLVIFDGAHNPQGIASAVENLQALLAPLTADSRVVLLMGVMADKDHKEMVEILAPWAAAVVTVRSNSSRALDSETLAMEFRNYGIPATAWTDLRSGVRAAVELAQRENKPLLCLGSLYLYADVKRAVIDAIQVN